MSSPLEAPELIVAFPPPYEPRVRGAEIDPDQLAVPRLIAPVKEVAELNKTVSLATKVWALTCAIVCHADPGESPLLESDPALAST